MYILKYVQAWVYVRNRFVYLILRLCITTAGTLPLTKKMAGELRLVRVIAGAGIFLAMGRRMI